MPERLTEQLKDSAEGVRRLQRRVTMMRCDGMFRELAVGGKCLVISAVQCKMEHAPSVLLGGPGGKVIGQIL